MFRKTYIFYYLFLSFCAHTSFAAIDLAYFNSEGGNAALESTSSSTYLYLSSQSSIALAAKIQVDSTLQVTSPNSGELLNIGSSHTITWTSSSVTDIMIEYSRNGGSTWIQIVASTPASAGAYQWTVPSGISTLCLIRISDAANNSIYDISDSVFSIVEKEIEFIPPLNVPWKTGSIHDIKWLTRNINTVKLEYSPDNGSTWSTISESINASAESYSWTVPNEASAQYQIRISDTSDVTVKDIVSMVIVASDFTDKSLKFDESNTSLWFGGDNRDATKGRNVGIGQSYFFEYDSHVTSVGFKLNRFFDYEQNPTLEGHSVSLVLYIRNESGDLYGISVKSVSADFNGGWVFFNTNLYADAQHKYIFTCFLHSGDTKQLTSHVSAHTEDKLLNSTGYIAEVYPGGSMDSWGSWREFNCDFNLQLSYQITPIHIISPSCPISLLAGSPLTIMWTSTGVSTVRLEYSTDNGMTWSIITDSTNASVGSYVWNIPASFNAGSYIIRIIDTTNESIQEVSDVIITIETSPTLAPSAWPMRGQNPQHTGRAIFTQGTSNTLKWNYPASDVIYSSPVIDTDGTVYFTTLYNGALIALTPDGLLKWTYKTGTYVFSTPAIDSEGTVYFGSHDRYIYAVKKDGTLKWRYLTENVIRSSPAINTEGSIYIGSNDGYVYCIRSDGTLKWKFQTNAAITSSPAIGTDGTVYFGSTAPFSGITAYYLYSVTSDGELKWKFMTNDAIQSSPAIDSDGTVYVGSDDWYVYAITSNGELKWKFDTGNIVSSSPAIDTDGTVYVGSMDNGLYAISSTGALKWKYTTDGAVNSSPVIDSQHTIFFGSNDRYLYALKSDGTLKWKYRTNADIASSPALTTDGTLYVGSSDQNLYAFAPEAPGITLVSPNGGETFLPGVSHTISWTATVISHVKVEFSTDNGSTWTAIGNNVPVSDSYLWTVPSLPSSDCLIRISDASNQAIADTSDASFSIVDTGLWGDVNNDGLITMLDALIIAKYDLYKHLDDNSMPALLVPYLQFIRLRGDVSEGARTITSADALMIARHVNNANDASLPPRIGKNQNAASKLPSVLYSAAPLHLDTDVRINHCEDDSYLIDISLNAVHTIENIGAGTIEVMWDPNSYRYEGYKDCGGNVVIADDWVNDGRLLLTRIDAIGSNPFTFPALLLKRLEHGTSDQITISVLNGVTTESYSELPAPITARYQAGNTNDPPHGYSLYQNTPNPFNPYTVIRYSLSRPADIKLTVFNSNGQKVKTLVDGYMTDGEHFITWDATDENGKKVASGMYIYRLNSQGYMDQKQMLLIR